MATTIKDFYVGQIVVAMSSEGVPCQCNSFSSGDPLGPKSPRPCRVTVVKVGRTRIYARMNGRLHFMTTPDNLAGQGLIAYPLDEARMHYGIALTRSGRDKATVARLVASL